MRFCSCQFVFTQENIDGHPDRLHLPCGKGQILINRTGKKAEKNITFGGTWAFQIQRLLPPTVIFTPKIPFQDCLVPSCKVRTVQQVLLLRHARHD